MFHSSTSHTYHHNSSWTIRQARNYLCLEGKFKPQGAQFFVCWWHQGFEFPHLRVLHCDVRRCLQELFLELANNRPQVWDPLALHFQLGDFQLLDLIIPRLKTFQKIESVNKAFLFWYWQWPPNFFFRNKTFLFFKIESWNFQVHFEIEFHETLQNFSSIRQLIKNMKIKIVWIS